MDCTACSQDPVPPVPAAIDNRPGLSAIAYRIGTFSSFREAMLDAIAGTPELAGLRTRLSDDYSITVLELWAAVADVLTFYQERIANEAYLRTATLRDSMLRLVRLIDYQLQPGLAPTAMLAFTLEPGAAATIPVGLRVQSVPVGDASPQKYESIEAITADARFNGLAILPAPEAIIPLTPGRASELLAPGADLVTFAATLAPGDRLAAYTPTNVELLQVAAVVVQADRVFLQWVIPPSADFSAAASGTTTSSGLFKVGRTFRLFGFDAPGSYIKTVLLDPNNPKSIRSELHPTDDLVLKIAASGDLHTGFCLDGRYDSLKPGAPLLIDILDKSGVTTTIYATVQAVGEGAASRGPVTGVATFVSATATAQPGGATFSSIAAATIHEWIGPPLRLLPAAFLSRLSEPDLYISGRRNGWDTIEVGRVVVKGTIQPGVTIAVQDLPAGREVILVDAEPSTAVSAAVTGTELVGDQLSLGLADDDVQTIEALGLDPTVARGITAMASPPLGALVSLRSAQPALQVTIGQHPAQKVVLSPPIAAPGPSALGAVAAALQAAIRAALPEAPEFAGALVFNSADIATGPACLVVVPGVAEVPIALAPTASDPDTIVDLGLDAAHVRYLDGVLSGPLNVAAAGSGSLMVTLGIREPQVVSPSIFSNPVATAQSLAAVIAAKWNLAEGPLILGLVGSGRILALPPVARFERPAFLHLTVAPDAPTNLDSASAVVLGNVARASLGETVANEIVGDGDASVPFQSFALRKKPVTFLLGDGPHGAQSTLSVAVRGVQWKEVATLFGAGPTDPVYVSRIADDQTLSLEFGDGVTGARLPSGRGNVVATYRQGIGLAGRVPASTLTSLLDSVNGLKRVTNPMGADGGADPQSLDDARTNAPTTVRTFGRAVSLEDFEDVALATGEIAKASATWVWTGLQKAVFLTVAAQAGGTLSPDGIRQLKAALLAHRDPNHRLLVDNFMRVPIIVAASLTVDPRYDGAAVRKSAFDALAASLSFDRMQLGQSIHLSGVYAVLQGVPGVTAADITDLNFKSRDPTFRKAHGADDRRPQPHLFVLGARPGTTPGVTVLPAELAWVDVPSQDLVLSVIGHAGA
jgi:hypothetical protein